MHAIQCVTAALVMLLPSSPPSSERPSELKVLYAGKPGSEREKDFTKFLREHFAKVGLADYTTLKGADTEGFDVVILDWPDTPPKTKFGLEFSRPDLGPDYKRPTVLIGGGTMAVGRHYQLKIDDLCTCLGDAAHSLVPSHSIFREPYEIRLDYEVRPTPPNYRSYPGGDRLGETMRVWKVQERGWSTEEPGNMTILPGMVSDPYGFTDSPDTEFIASGLNTKSPEAVAIGRHGNFLLWGFNARPSDLTPEARKCFINSVCYIRRFDGHRPAVRKARGQLARTWALVYALAYKEACDTEHFAMSLPKEVRGNRGQVAELSRKRANLFRNQFPESVRRSLGDEPDRYIEYYRSNMEFLRPPEAGGVPFLVDEDVKQVSLSNRRIELLDRCIAMLERGEDPEKALRILKRYTTEDFADVGGWRSWLKANREHLFFTDSGGYKFLIAGDGLGRGKSVPAAAGEADARTPVVATAEFTSAEVRPGKEVNIVVQVKVAPNWHIYAVGGSKGAGLATSLTLKLPQGIEAEGEWTLPEPTRGSDGQLIYEGTVKLSRTLRVARDVNADSVTVRCVLNYQACDQFSCRSPAELRVEAQAKIAR